MIVGAHDVPPLRATEREVRGVHVMQDEGAIAPTTIPYARVPVRMAVQHSLKKATHSGHSTEGACRCVVLLA